MEKDIVVWLNEQPAWVRRTTEIFVKQGAVSESVINELTDICIAEAQGIDCSRYKVEQSNLFSLDSSDSFSIKSMSDLEGVNALAPNKPLEFSDNGISVIYGANGTGKSGYIRVLKMLSGATYREDIKPNIYAKKKCKQKCVIDILKNGNIEQYLCDLTIPGQHEVLRKIDIFDTKVAQGYIGDEKEASFEPWIFELFKVLGQTAELVKGRIVDKKNEIQLQKYNIPDEVRETEKIKDLMCINSKTNPDTFICDWLEDDEKELGDLKEKLQIEKNLLKMKVIEGQKGRLIEVYNYFNGFKNFYDKRNLGQLDELSAEWEKKIEIYELSQKLLEDNIDLTDKLHYKNDVWISLWQYARKYADISSENSSKDFNEEGGICPLCHQMITKEAASRIQTIDQYVNGDAADAEKKAKQQYLQQMKYSSVVQTNILLQKVDEFSDILGKIVSNSNELIIQNEKRIKSIDKCPIKIEKLLIDEVLTSIQKIIDELEIRNKSIADMNADKDQQKVKVQIAELEAKKIISDNKEIIRTNIEKLRSIDQLDIAIKKTSTNKITSKSRELAKFLLTDAYIKRFNEELKKLSASGLTAQIVQAKSKKGKIPYKLQLCDAEGKFVSPQDILSEGENRAVALAAFFAEASGRTDNCPLIVDDPISSLDYEYETRVIKRLVEAATRRQVIVFTHRISVVVGISEEASRVKGINFEEQSLRVAHNRKGIPSEPDVSAGKPDKLLNRLLGENLSHLKKMDETTEEFNFGIHYLCQQFRNCIEKSVETYLIGEVVARFRRDVQTRRIRYLPSITEDDCKIVDELMTKYSYYDHSMSTETPLIEFPVEEIEKDMNDFKKWMEKRKQLLNKK